MLPKRRIPEVELGKHRGMNPQYGLKKGDCTSPLPETCQLMPVMQVYALSK